MRAVHANCFPGPGIEADALLTDEPAVAAAAGPIRVESPEAAVDPEVAHRLSADTWQLACSWFRLPTGEDPTLVAGISVGDLAMLEAAITVLLPAARGALSMASILRGGRLELDRLISVAPGVTAGAERYARLERLAAEAAGEAARHLAGAGLEIERQVSVDPRNLKLIGKYVRTRDPDLLIPRTGGRARRQALLDLANGLALLRGRRRSTLLVVEYNPTLAFSRAYSGLPRSDRMRLARWIADPRDLLDAVRAGDLVQGAPMASPGSLPLDPSESSAEHGDDAVSGTSFEVAGVPLWPLVKPRLQELIGRYGAFVAQNAPGLARRLERWNVQAVLVPYDTSPAVRLLLRVAQASGIPTFALSDGYKADEIQIEGMSADVALAWSTSMRDHYFSRHPGRVIVTGNPKPGRFQGRSWRGLSVARPRILVGTFTFSPVDLNCRRSDPERFLDEVLAGIAGALPSVAAEVIVKLHPGDEPAHYELVLERHPGLQIELRTRGDVVDMFDEADLYVTTASTSLLEAALVMPVIFYRVGPQRFQPPFEGDEFLAERTAATASELTALLLDRQRLQRPPEPDWSQRYLGPAGALERIAATIGSAVATAPGAAVDGLSSPLP